MGWQFIKELGSVIWLHLCKNFFCVLLSELFEKFFLLNRLKQGKDLGDFIFVEQSETHYSLCWVKFSEDIYNICGMAFSKKVPKTLEVFGFNEFLNFRKKYFCPLKFHNFNSVYSTFSTPSAFAIPRRVLPNRERFISIALKSHTSSQQKHPIHFFLSTITLPFSLDIAPAGQFLTHS